MSAAADDISCIIFLFIHSCEKRFPMRKNIKRRHTILKIILFILLFLFVLVLAAFILLHSYLGRINYQRDPEAAAAGAVPAETDPAEESPEDAVPIPEEEERAEEEETSLQDSAAEEIAALEQRLLEQTSGVEEVLFDEDVLNILLIGYDSRDTGSRGRSDTNILVSVNRDTKVITMTSVMRDCYVSIPGHGNNRINAAYAYGGGSLLSETIEKNFQISVDHYAAVNFYAFMDIIDIIGGVDIEVSDAETEVMNRYIKELNRLEGCEAEKDLLSGGGVLHLNGKQTLAYARVRYVGNADFERTQRQRTVLEKVFEKAKEMNLLDMNDLLKRLLPEITTDMNEREVLFLLLEAPAFLQYDLESLRIPADGTYESLRISGMEVLGVDLEKNRRMLEERVYGTGEGGTDAASAR